MTEQVKDILVKARAIISDEAIWGQSNGGKSGQHCMTTAIDLQHNLSREVRDVAVRHLAAIIGGQPDPSRYKSHYTTVWNYNDAKGRSHREVLAMFDKAIGACSVSDHQS